MDDERRNREKETAPAASVRLRTKPASFNSRVRVDVTRTRQLAQRKRTPMLTITAVIRARKGEERALRDALLEVADNVRANEPETIGFFISQDLEDPCVFTTYERFADRAAMDRHNNSAVVARFFGIADAGRPSPAKPRLHRCRSRARRQANRLLPRAAFAARRRLGDGAGAAR